MELALAIGLIGIGAVVLLFGARLVILGAAIGALLGFALVRLIPGANEGFIALLIPIILAVIFAFGGGFMRGMVGLITLALGAVAGAAIVFNVLQLFELNFGILDWILAIVGAVVGAILVQRFADWAIYFFAGFVGALLVIRGLQVFFPEFNDTFATILGLVLLAASIGFESGLLGGRKQQVK